MYYRYDSLDGRNSTAHKHHSSIGKEAWCRIRPLHSTSNGKGKPSRQARQG